MFDWFTSWFRRRRRGLCYRIHFRPLRELDRDLVDFRSDRWDGFELVEVLPPADTARGAKMYYVSVRCNRCGVRHTFFCERFEW